MDSKQNTPIAALGHFGLIEKLTCDVTASNPSTVLGVGDDAAVIEMPGSDRYGLISTDMLLEGVHFDLTYFPLKHLGYKAVVVGCSDIYAMNGTPAQMTVALGVSAKFTVQMLEEFYAGIRAACADYGIDLVGGDTSTSITGFTVAVTVWGNVGRDMITYRSGARVNDLICITGDLGAAYMGLRLLDRERRVLDGHDDPQPKFEGYEYLLRRQLMPTAQRQTVELLAREALVPTSMIDLTDGLASDLLQICKASGCGARIYLERIPISSQTYAMAEELHSDPVMSAMNGGDDFELMFTVPVAMQDKIVAIGGIDIIGHITEQGQGVALVTPDGSHIRVTAPGWVAEAQ